MTNLKLLSAAFMLVLLSVGVGYWLYARSNHKQAQDKTKILMIGVDAGSWDIARELMAEDKMPNFKNLVQEGAAGYLNSVNWKELIHGDKGYFSPIVWASISTGKMPTKHGIEDFTMPLPWDMIASILPAGPTGYSVVRVPDVVGHSNIQLWFRARASAPATERRIGVYLNQSLLKEITVGKDWKVYDIRIPSAAWKLQNSLNFFYEVSENEKNKPAVDFNFIRFFDQYGQEIFDFHVLREKQYYVSGWQILQPEKTTIASATHLRARPMWDILSEYRKHVGVVGWWETWPAPEVNGYLVSSHTGLHGERIKEYGTKWLEKIERLTYPADYLKRVQQLAFVPHSIDPEIRKRFYDIDKCSCIGSAQDRIFRNFFWQDRLFEVLSMDLLKSKGPFDFFAVYFCGVDAAGHQFLRFKEKEELLKDCTGCDASRLPFIVENYYRYTDEVIGKLMSFADENTVIMLVTDHGQFLGPGVAGLHKNNGFVVLHGAPIRPHLMMRASVLDVAPTVLYLMGLPVPQDMDGTVMLEAFRPEYLEKHPIRYRRTYETITTQTKEQPEIRDEEAEKEGLEKLKALGYIQ